MKFIVKICDDRGFELSRHEQYAEPHYSPTHDTVTFYLEPCSYRMTRRYYEEMIAVRKKNETD